MCYCACKGSWHKATHKVMKVLNVARPLKAIKEAKKEEVLVKKEAKKEEVLVKKEDDKTGLPCVLFVALCWVFYMYIEL